MILLLLLLGLEYSASELLGSLRASAPAGLADLVLNFSPGLLAGLLLGWSALAAVVLGGVTYVTSSGIVAKVLGDLNRLGNRETPVILSVLVIEDLAMAAYLPLLTGALVGGGLLASALPVGVALAAVALVLLVAVRYGETLSRLVFSPSASHPAGRARPSPGRGRGRPAAAGLGRGGGVPGRDRPVGRAAEAAHDLLTPLRDLFAAVFFVFFRLQTDPGRSRRWPSPPPPWPWSGGDQGGHGLVGGQADRVGPRGRWRAGTSLVPRGSSRS